MNTVPSTLKFFFASWRPLFARKLNERSSRPPMSVTSVTLNFAGAAWTSDFAAPVPAPSASIRTAISAAATSGMNVRTFTYPP